MKKIWIWGALLAFVGCQPDVGQSPVAPPTTVAEAPQKLATPAEVPPPQQAPAKVAATPAKEAVAPLPSQTTKADVAVAPPAATTETAAPVKTEATVEKLPVHAAPTASSGQLFEAEAIALAKKKNCFACHALDKKVVGPAWRDVAKKYRGDVSAQTFLENKIVKGGGGVWGKVPMPAQPGLGVEQSAQLARYILNLE